MSAKLSKSINLMNPVMAPEDIWTKIYVWVTKVGRFLLVAVAVLVLGVFFARFFLDKQNNDLTNNNINPKVAVLQDPTLRANEQKFRNYQLLLTDINTIIKNQKTNSLLISSVLSAIPSNFELKTISFIDNSISLAMSAAKLEDIGKYTAQLNADSTYANVSSSISKSGSSSGKIDFSVTFDLASSTTKVTP